MKKKRTSLFTKSIIAALGLIATCLFAYLVLAGIGAKPYIGAEDNAIILAKRQTSLETAKEFDIVNTDQTTYTVTGVDDTKEDVAALISEKNGKVKLVKLADGVAKSSLPNSSKAISIKLGIYQGKEVWEVRSKSNDYHLYDFKDGSEVA